MKILIFLSEMINAHLKYKKHSNTIEALGFFLYICVFLYYYVK